MSAGQESGSPIRENRTLLPAPLPPDEARGTLAAAAGVSTVGLRPPFDTPQRHSHPVCRAILTLIVALDSRTIKCAVLACGIGFVAMTTPSRLCWKQTQHYGPRKSHIDKRAKTAHLRINHVASLHLASITTCFIDSFAAS